MCSAVHQEHTSPCCVHHCIVSLSSRCCCCWLLWAALLLQEMVFVQFGWHSNMHIFCRDGPADGCCAVGAAVRQFEMLHSGTAVRGCWSLSHGWHNHTWQLELLGLLQGVMAMRRVLCSVRACMRCTYCVAAVLLGGVCLVWEQHFEQCHSRLLLCRQTDRNYYAMYSSNNVQLAASTSL